MFKNSFLIILLINLTLSFSCSNTIYNPLIIMGSSINYNDSNADKRIKIASVCLECSKDKDVNLKKMKSMIDSIMFDNPDTRVIIFGETILGYYYDKNDPKGYQISVSETIPGRSTDFICSISKNYNIYIGFGLSEKSNNNIYNSFVMINNNGEIIANHRKHNFFKYDIESGFTKSDNFTIIEIDGIKTCIFICADTISKYLISKYKEYNVELAILSIADFSAESKIDYISRLLNCWSVVSNRSGYEGSDFYKGEIGIFNPAGTKVCGSESGGERYSIYNIGVIKK